MAMDKSGTVTDPFGGRDDIEKKIIRCVGDATARFREDALRIIRALRFASTLGFEIEESTALAIGQCRPLLSCVAGERIFTELSKLLLGDSALNVLLKYKDEICTVIPELSPCVGFDQHNSYHIYTVYDHIAHAVDCCPKDLHIRLAMLLHDIGKPPLFFIGEDGRGHFWGHPELSEEMAEGVLKRLRVDSELLRHVCFLIKHHDVRPAPTRKSLGKYLLKVGFKGARELLHVRKADILSQAPQYFYQLDDLEESARIIDRLESEGFCVSVHDLCVNGKDLMDLGLPQGKAVGKLLDELLSLVASEQIKNERDALLAAAKKRISSRRDS